MTDKITEFRGEYAWLSNFAPCFPAERSVEHMFQASKAGTKEDQQRIMHAPTPAEARRLGRQLTKLRPDWEQMHHGIMFEWLHLKFAQKEFKAKLLATGDAILEEGNTWGDRHWGISPPGSGQGKNLLGRMLMCIREEIKLREGG